MYKDNCAKYKGVRRGGLTKGTTCNTLNIDTFTLSQWLIADKDQQRQARLYL